MNFRPMVFLGCLLPIPVYPQEPPPLAAPRWERQAGGLKLATPQAATAVYQLSGPDRLCIEFAGAQMSSVLPSAPSLPGVEKVRWSQSDLSHVVCEISLGYQLPPQQIQWTPQEVRFQTEFSWEDRFPVVPGLIWNRWERAQGGRYLLWNELVMDPGQSGLDLEIGLAKERTDSREKTSEMVSRLQAVAGINGGYFAGSGGPLGIVYKGGKLLSPHVSRRPPRTTLGVKKDRTLAMDQVVAQKNQLASRSGENWNDVQLALGGGPRLLRRGQLALTTDEEELGPKGNDITRIAARTAVATDRSGKIVLVTASGYRDNHLQGLRLEELARELVRRGGSEAMNLDGGASTSMTVGAKVVSYGPAAPRFEKPVATALLVRSTEKPRAPATLQLQSSLSRLPADGKSGLQLTASVRDAQGQPVPDGTPVRFYSERLQLPSGLVKTQGGTATLQAQSVSSVGKARIWAECGPARDAVTVESEASGVSRLWAQLAPTAGEAGKFLLTVQAVDASLNGVRGVEVQFGEVTQTTFANGQCRFEVVLPPGSPASQVPVQCQGVVTQVSLPAVEAEVPLPSPSPSPTPTPTPPPEL